MNAQEAKQAMLTGATVVLTTGQLAGTKLRAVKVQRGGTVTSLTFEASMLGNQPWQPIQEAVIDRTTAAEFDRLSQPE